MEELKALVALVETCNKAVETKLADYQNAENEYVKALEAVIEKCNDMLGE